jgi:hypothetical protein
VPLPALELVLDARSDAVVRADWEALRAAGLPSQADHRGASNRPHVTVLAAAGLTAAVVAAAREALAPWLPLVADTAGVLTLGTGRLVLARPVRLPVAALDAVEQVRALAVPVPPGPWRPHLTLSRRLPADRLAEALLALAALGTGAAGRVTLTAVRHWDPATGRTTLLCGHDDGADPRAPGTLDPPTTGR